MADLDDGTRVTSPAFRTTVAAKWRRLSSDERLYYQDVAERAAVAKAAAAVTPGRSTSWRSLPSETACLLPAGECLVLADTTATAAGQEGARAGLGQLQQPLAPLPTGASTYTVGCLCGHSSSVLAEGEVCRTAAVSCGAAVANWQTTYDTPLAPSADNSFHFGCFGPDSADPRLRTATAGAEASTHPDPGDPDELYEPEGDRFCCYPKGNCNRLPWEVRAVGRAIGSEIRKRTREPKRTAAAAGTGVAADEAGRSECSMMLPRLQT